MPRKCLLSVNIKTIVEGHLEDTIGCHNELKTKTPASAIKFRLKGFKASVIQ